MKIVSIISLLLGFVNIYAQEEIIFTRDFTARIDHLGLEVYYPTEDWIHPVPLQEDYAANYDMTLVSEDDSTEMRYIFKEIEDSSSFLNFPQLEFSRMMSEMATTNQRAYIKVSEIPPRIVQDKYNADWGLVGDFIPNPILTARKKGRSMLLFKEDHSIIIVLIFYDNEILPPFYKLPIAYKE